MIKEKQRGRFESDRIGSLLLVRVLGEIDHHSAVSMRSGIDEEILDFRPTRLILDLSGVDFMDSSGLGLILGRYAAIKGIGGDLVVLNPTQGVMRILKLAGAERIIKIENVDLDAALEKYRENNEKKADKSQKGGKRK